MLIALVTLLMQDEVFWPFPTVVESLMKLSSSPSDGRCKSQARVESLIHRWLGPVWAVAPHLFYLITLSLIGTRDENLQLQTHNECFTRVFYDNPLITQFYFGSHWVLDRRLFCTRLLLLVHFYSTQSPPSDTQLDGDDSRCRICGVYYNFFHVTYYLQLIALFMGPFCTRCHQYYV